MILVIGLPWIMSKLVAMTQKRIQSGDPSVQLNQTQMDPQSVHPSQIKDLEFCRAIYDFNSTTRGDLSFKRGDIIAILEKMSASDDNASSAWWRGRTQAGKVGIFPSNYVALIPKKQDGLVVPSAPSTFDTADFK